VSRPRTYDFPSLGVGDRLVVALNRRDPKSVITSIRVAAKQYAQTYAPGFQVGISAAIMPGFVVVERLGDDRSRTALLVDADKARVARLDALSRTRSLSDGEVGRLYRATLRINRRAA
jgi:hypothetical protein